MIKLYLANLGKYNEGLPSRPLSFILLLSILAGIMAPGGPDILECGELVVPHPLLSRRDALEAREGSTS